MTESCYYCGGVATSREHVPPECVFPERKDCFGKDYRKNLITVPSCDEHNLKKSKDDEFLMASVTAVVGNNGAAFIQTHTKLRRAFDRNNRRLIDLTIPNARDAVWLGPRGKKFPVLVGEANMPRLIGTLEHIARGLYFHATKKRFLGVCHIIPDWIKFPDPDVETIKLIARMMTGRELGNWIRFGDNPDVFEFHIGPADMHGLMPMLMTFFRGTKVYVTFQPEGIKPPFRTLDDATPENPLVIDIHFSPGQPT